MGKIDQPPLEENPGVPNGENTSISSLPSPPPSNKEGSLWVKIVLLVIIVCTTAGLYLLKNPITPNEASTPETVFALDATKDFNLKKNLGLGYPTMIDFGATSCIPCKEMAPILEELNTELEGKAIIKFVDVWKNKSASDSVIIDLIPTQFFWNADGSPYIPSQAEARGFALYSDDTGAHILTAHEGAMSKEEILFSLEEMGMKP